MNDLVSIITPVYNGEKWISECIESVIAQTYKNWELIIVNDNSKDSTVEIVNRYVNDKRIKLLSNDINRGVDFSRNLALNSAKGDFIAFLDSDDLWYPEKLEKQISFMKQNNYNFTFTSYERFYDNGETINIIHVPPKITYNDYLKNTIIGCLTVIINRRNYKNFRLGTGKLEDVKTWMIVLKEFSDGYGLDENLAKYRVSSNSASSNKFKNAKLYFDCLRKHERLGLLKSCFYEILYIYNAVKKRLKS